MARIPGKLKQAVGREADRDRRSVADVVNLALEFYLTRQTQRGERP
ncbi:MAG: hypothetical protein JWO36_5668 [Myxococcales bacterium]|nr:hypothetical protein [Myxococcales bacterium]